MLLEVNQGSESEASDSLGLKALFTLTSTKTLISRSPHRPSWHSMWACVT